MSIARVLTVTVPAEIAEALDQSVQRGEFASDGEALVAAAKSWQERRDLIERQKEAIRRDIKASLDDPRPSIPIEEVERHMERYMAQAREIAPDEKA
jgi:antitoxin ParD1/3/4